MEQCKFCKDEYQRTGVKYHERYCKSNPNKHTMKAKTQNWKDAMKNKHHSNQYIKATETGIPYILSEEARMNMRNGSARRKHTAEEKQALSMYAKRRGLGGVTQSRWIKYNGKILGSSYELEVATDLDKNNIKWDTCTRFNYIDPFGKSRTYTPDIYLVDYDIYLDPKNDFLIEHINPSLGFNDCEKIKLVEKQNNITVIILNKYQLHWKYIQSKI